MGSFLPGGGLLTGVLTSQGICDRWQQNEWGGNNSFLSPISGGCAPAVKSGQNRGSRKVVQAPLVTLELHKS